MWKPSIPTKRELIILAVVLAALVACFGLGKYLDTASRERDSSIQVLAGLPAEHGISPKTIHLKAGEEAILRLTSKDTTYAFLIPAFDVNVEPVKPGVFNVLRFTPEKPGTYPFYYNQLGSDNNLSQSGTLIVAP